MTPKQITEMLSNEDVINILSDLTEKHPRKHKNGLIFMTDICHGGDSFKLYYYSESKTFHCFSGCNKHYSIFDLIKKKLDCDFPQAYEYVCMKLGISVSAFSTGFHERRVDNSFINRFKKQKQEHHVEIRDKSVLNSFYNMCHQSWINDHITIETMLKFGIKFDIEGYRIIIPHYDINNNLIGVRCRNLKPELVAEGKKYMPIVVNEILYNYPTSMNLYGINFNKDNIRKYKKVIILESEKGVLQHKSFYDNSIAVAISGSSLHSYQIELLRNLEVEEVIIALDKEFTNEIEEEEYKAKIQNSFINQLSPYFNVSIIWDTQNKLEHKMSPTDKGKEVFEELYKNKIMV